MSVSAVTQRYCKVRPSVDRQWYCSDRLITQTISDERDGLVSPYGSPLQITTLKTSFVKQNLDIFESEHEPEPRSLTTCVSKGGAAEEDHAQKVYATALQSRNFLIFN